MSSIWVEIRYKDTSFLLSNVYRSPNTPISFWQDLNISVENASDLVKRVIIVGDINEDQLNINSRYLKYSANEQFKKHYNRNYTSN